jgi:excinuclease UvrABC nuclease subunit
VVANATSAEDPTTMGYVYIYRSGDGNVFKIGKAKDIANRIRAHATGNPEPLTEFDVIESEHAPLEADLARQQLA